MLLKKVLTKVKLQNENNSETNLSLPIRNLLGLIFIICTGLFAYFDIVERLNNLETADKLQQQDLLEASAQKPIDQEQFMLLEHMAEQLEKLTERVDAMMNNKVNIERLQKDVDRISIDVEKLKDSVRANIGKLNGNSH
jgi:small-conductance mechanosensitive channel